MQSNDVVFGLVGVVAGLLFCFAGARILRAAITVWGAFAGFVVGAQLVASWSDRTVLHGVTAWIVAFVLAIVFAALAWLYYYFAVIVGVGSLGYGVATAVMTHAGWGTDGTRVAVALAAAVVVGLIALVLQLPTLLLIVASAIAGAYALVGGVGVLTQHWTSAEVLDGSAVHLGWITAVVAVLGVVAQSRTRPAATQHRDGWH